MAMPKGMMRRNTGGRFTHLDGLTDKQAAFVAAYVENGCRGAAAAEAAGCAHPRVDAWRMMQKPAVRQAIAEAVRTRMSGLAHRATSLIEMYLQAWEAAIEKDPSQALRLDIKELRSLLASAADKLLPPPRAEEVPVQQQEETIEELEAKVARLRLIASDAARLVEAGEVEP